MSGLCSTSTVLRLKKTFDFTNICVHGFGCISTLHTGVPGMHLGTNTTLTFSKQLMMINQLIVDLNNFVV